MKNWEIKPNGADVIATNRVTGEVFTGTRTQLNTKLLSLHQDNVSRALTQPDAERQLSSDSASAVVYTIPTDRVLGDVYLGKTLTAYQAGTGTVSFVAGPGVTLVGTANSSGRYQSVEVQYIGVNTWAVVNKVTAALDANSNFAGLTVPGGALIGVSVPFTFSALLSAISMGYVGSALITDVGNGSIWVSDGVRARALNGEVVIYKSSGVVNFAATIPRTIGIEVPLPVGIWKDNDVIEVTAELSKSGAVDTATPQINIGNIGVSGVQIGGANLNMSAANRRSFGTFRIKRNSATSVTLLNGATGQDGAASGTDLATTTVTVSDMDSAQRYLQITNAMGTGGSDVVTINAARVKVITG